MLPVVDRVCGMRAVAMAALVVTVNVTDCCQGARDRAIKQIQHAGRMHDEDGLPLAAPVVGADADTVDLKVETVRHVRDGCLLCLHRSTTLAVRRVRWHPYRPERGQALVVKLCDGELRRG